MNAPANPVANTDRELWRERPGDYYADSIHVTVDGSIGIDCGGTVFVMPVRKWHALAALAQTNNAGRGEPPAGWKWELVRLPPLCAKCGRESSVHDDNDPDRECEKYTPTVADGLLRAVQAARGGLAPTMPGTMPRPLDAPPSGAAVPHVSEVGCIVANGVCIRENCPNHSAAAPEKKSLRQWLSRDEAEYLVDVLEATTVQSNTAADPETLASDIRELFGMVPRALSTQPPGAREG